MVAGKTDIESGAQFGHHSHTTVENIHTAPHCTMGVPQTEAMSCRAFVTAQQNGSASQSVPTYLSQLSMSLIANARVQICRPILNGIATAGSDSAE